MELIATIRNNEGDFQEKFICKVPSPVLTSIMAIRKLLCTHAERQWGGSEGNTYSICNDPNRHALIPLYARNRKTGETLGIK